MLQASYMMAQSAPVYYHPLASSLPNNGFAMPQARHFMPQYGAPQGYLAPHPSESGSEYTGASSYGSHSTSSYAAMPGEYHEEAYVRTRPRNTSAPPMPMMAHNPMYGGAWPMASTFGSVGYEPHMSASYQDHSPLNGGFPVTAERKPSSARLGRRRPSGVPALSFSGLSSSAGAAGFSPATSITMTPHSGRSIGSSMSDFDSQFSPSSTPRSNGSTPRSSTSTPRSGMNEKKRSRTGIPHPLERERRVRPKVVAEKGALQCKGVNRKKNTRCRNAALMEYIGPRPLYCAEHITLDPESFYSKCASTYHKVNGDGKGCREVVLKELQFCHKHYNQALDVLLDGTEAGFLKARTQLDRISSLQAQLEAEAVAAKRVDPDLFQRKHKLIPKFMEMKKLLLKRMQEYQSAFPHLALNTAQVEFKYDEQNESKDSSSITTSPSGSSDEVSVAFGDESANPSMMQVEAPSFQVY